MNLNYLIFPSPKPYYTESTFQDLIWIPKDYQNIFNLNKMSFMTNKDKNNDYSVNQQIKIQLQQQEQKNQQQQNNITSSQSLSVNNTSNNIQNILQANIKQLNFNENNNNHHQKNQKQIFKQNSSSSCSQDNKENSSSSTQSSSKQSSKNYAQINQQSSSQYEKLKQFKLETQMSLQEAQKNLEKQQQQKITNIQKSNTIPEIPMSYQNKIPLYKSANINKDQKYYQNCIPCIFLQNSMGSDKIFVFFHGNAEDLGIAIEFARTLLYYFKVNVLCVEYPGYGIYKGSSNSDLILRDSEIIFDFLVDIFNYNPSNIFLFGRSIGSGPSTHLAAVRRPGLLVLMSPFTSIRDVARSMCGNVCVLLAERFQNIEKIPNVVCPILFIHGCKDNLIPYSHAQKLLWAAENCICHLHLSPTMTHNDFNLEEDLIKPIQYILKKCAITIQNHSHFRIQVPDILKKKIVKTQKVNKKSESFIEKIVNNN